MKRKKISLTNKILISLLLGIVMGIVFNLYLPKTLNVQISKWILKPLGDIFLRAIKMVVVPLVLFSLICGTASVSDLRRLGRVGGKILAFYMATSALAISLALVFSNMFNFGHVEKNISAIKSLSNSKPDFIMDIFVNMVPTNPIEAMVKGEMLQVIVFAILFGVAITLIGDRGKPIVDLFSRINDVLLKIIAIVMKFAPVGVFALLANVIITQGIDVLRSLFTYVGVVVLVLLIYMFIINGIALKLLGKVNPITFFKKYFSVMLVGFSTSSSNAAIPANLETCEEKLGVPKSISSFTIPLGATINMNGTAIMQGVAVIFIAQVYGINLSIYQQIMAILVAVLSSIGTAGVPSAGVVMLTMVLQQVGLPIEGAALVLSVDRIVDMFRTAANITGDAVGTVVVANSENELDLNVYNDTSISNKKHKSA
ncbi:dicarboxylate/amino acid:cation symporter [Haloimpatiens sp. FM7330]|uniref:dicarboxylate/amino acid:cation symporter n=1 Tax=Haloimpatiens sp. FM7330 TaxID=3298610 RepID=UPI0036281DEE